MIMSNRDTKLILTKLSKSVIELDQENRQLKTDILWLWVGFILAMIAAVSGWIA